MILLTCSEELKELQSWKNRLEEMVVSHTIVKSQKGEPYLKEGQRMVKGIDAINHFLNQYEKDVASWNQDRCDMWFFDN